MSDNVVKLPAGDVFEVPPLGSVMAFRGVHALADLNPATGTLRATHYATCLIGGSSPMWGVWSVNGVFQRFFGSKTKIAEAYPRKTWRRRSATWNLVSVHNMIAEEKRQEMRRVYRKGETASSGEPVALLLSDGRILPWSDHTKIGTQTYRPLYAGTETSEPPTAVAQTA